MLVSRLYLQLAIGNIIGNIEAGELEMLQDLIVSITGLAFYQQAGVFFQPQAIAVAVRIVSVQGNFYHGVACYAALSQHLRLVPERCRQ